MFSKANVAVERLKNVAVGCWMLVVECSVVSEGGLQMGFYIYSEVSMISYSIPILANVLGILHL